MALIIADRVRDTSTTTGTGNFTVSGSAPSTYRTFSAVCTAADTFPYFIASQTLNEWEVGLATYSSANVIARTTVYASSNAGSLVAFSTATKDVVLSETAEKSGVSDYTLTTLNVKGSTSGVVTIQGSTAAGTYNFNLPTTVGTAGQFLQSQGGSGTTPMLWTSTPVLGAPGATGGSISLKGSTTGTVTIQPTTAGGIYNFNMPATAGSAGQCLTSQGGGSSAMTWTSPIVSDVTPVNTGSYPIWDATTGTTVIDGKGFINVIAFGADPTGSASCDTAFANAVTAVSSSGGTIYIPAGTYKLTATWTINAANVTIVGDGPGTIILQSLTSVDAVALTSVGNCTLRDFQIKYPSLASAGYGLDVSRAGSIFSNVYENLHIVNAYNAFHSHNENVAFYHNLFASGVANIAFHFDATNNVILDTFDFSGDSSTFHTTSIGLFMQGSCQGCVLSNGEFFQFNRSSSLGSSTSIGSSPAYCAFNNIYFNDGWQQDLHNGIYDCMFTDCQWSNGTKPGGDNGLGITSGSNIRFHSCDWAFNGGNGCLVQSGVINTSFIGCSFIANSTLAGSGVDSGLVFGAGVTDFVVQGCIAKNDTSISGTANQKYGILVSSGASDRYIISGNLVSTNVTGGVLDGGSGVNKSVTANF